MVFRNFAILAHVDHGKSTLADRMLEITGAVDKRKMRAQYLDQLELERERGITIKMAPVRMEYKGVILNLIDTPGHSDFSYEVSRALAAVEGAILLVDATQGIQAQTLAKFEAAKAAGLKIIGAVTKIDLNSSILKETIKAIADLIGDKPENIIKVSGKTGEGVEELLEVVIGELSAPKSTKILKRVQDDAGGGRALIFDSFYDSHKGIIAFVRMFNGEFRQGETVEFAKVHNKSKIKELGFFSPELKPVKKLEEGEIGYIATGIKDPDLIKIGDTVVSRHPELVSGSTLTLRGYQEPQPVVFVSFYPQNADEHDNLKQALAKLRLNDSSLFYEPDKSELLGRGFKCGFLGQLHFEITAERLAGEFGIETVQSFPSVAYRVILSGSEESQTITNPKDFPDDYKEAQEPITEVKIISPPEYLGAVLALRKNFRFSDIRTENLDKRSLIKVRLPLADLISDFDDKLKSITKGMTSLNYRLIGYEAGNLTKAEVLVAGHLVPGLTRILPSEKAEKEMRQMLEKLKKLLPRRQFAQALQARIRGQIVARENIPALRKDVTGYLYGGDRTRKMKLWKKQQKGKAKLKERAKKDKIDIPSSVFRELLKK